jgi:hypothetical protein
MGPFFVAAAVQGQGHIGSSLLPCPLSLCFWLLQLRPAPAFLYLRFLAYRPQGGVPVAAAPTRMAHGTAVRSFRTDQHAWHRSPVIPN